MSARPSLTIEPTRGETRSYARGLHALAEDKVPFLVGGALALAAYCGMRRSTKDLDLFVLEEDVPRVLGTLQRAGFRTERPYPHWLAKAHAGEHFIDVIYNSGNGAAPVDEEWFEHAPRATVYGVEVRLCPVEETIWSKAYVMERERFDGADIAHLLLACGQKLDWKRLLRRFGDNWRVLLAHLVLFGFAFPDEAERVPRWALDELTARLPREHGRPRGGRVCHGTLLSREQYLPDLLKGWRDARLRPTGTMTPEEVAIWTRAIGKH